MKRWPDEVYTYYDWRTFYGLMHLHNEAIRYVREGMPEPMTIMVFTAVTFKQMADHVRIKTIANRVLAFISKCMRKAERVKASKRR